MWELTAGGVTLGGFFFPLVLYKASSGRWGLLFLSLWFSCTAPPSFLNGVSFPNSRTPGVRGGCSTESYSPALKVTTLINRQSPF